VERGESPFLLSPSFRFHAASQQLMDLLLAMSGCVIAGGRRLRLNHSSSSCKKQTRYRQAAGNFLISERLRLAAANENLRLMATPLPAPTKRLLSAERMQLALVGIPRIADLVILVVARDGIEPPTPAFSGPRSTTELSGLGETKDAASA
jgi:hypothetical protein